MKNAWLITLIGLWLVPWTSAFGLQPTVQNGVLDLRGRDLNEAVDASGDWEFYWEKLLTPSTIGGSAADIVYLKVPGLWSQDSLKRPATGYATYRLRVVLDRSEKITVSLPAYFWSSSLIFVDGERIAEFGKVGRSAAESKGDVGMKIYEFVPKNRSFDIIIQISNFEFFLNGISEPPVLGTHDALTHRREKSVGIDLFLVGSLFIIGIYHVCLYLLRTEDRSTVWFGLLCLCIGLHISGSGVGSINVFISSISFDNRLRIYIFSWMGAVVALGWFTRFIFRGLYPKWLPWTASITALGFFTLVVATPARVFADIAMLYQSITGLIIASSVFTTVRACRMKEDGAPIYLAGIVIFLGAAINDLLAVRQIIHSPALTGFGLFIFVFFQSYMIAMRFSAAFVRVRISEKEIRGLSNDLRAEHDRVIQLNENLEHLVDEKTRDIRSMMEHIPLGVFMIQEDNRIHKDHSKQVQEIFKGYDLDTMNATQVVFSESLLSSDEKSQAISCITASIGEHPINFESNAHILPLEMRRREPDGKVGIFDFTWNVIENAEGMIDKILVTVRDVTEVRALQDRTRDQQKELEFIGEILNVPTARFIRFIQSCRELLQENNKLILSHGLEKRNFEILKLLFINMHTIKGAARSLYFKKMTEIFHDVEQYYAHLQTNTQADWDIPRMKQDLEEAQNIVLIYEKIGREKLGRHPELTHRVEFDVDQVESAYRRLSELTRDHSLPGHVTSRIVEVAGVLHQKLFRDAHEVFDEIFGCLPVLARDLHKESPKVQIDAGGYLLSDRAEDLLRNTFIHILRNSMDHGIETAAERTAQGKDPRGQIEIKLHRIDQKMVVTYRDDGRGLHLKKIRELGLARNLIPAGESNPQTIAAIIFDSGLSTANRVTDISGRGVGMDAVQRFFVQAGGQIQIELLDGQRTLEDFHPFRFVIEMPINLFENARSIVNQNAA